MFFTGKDKKSGGSKVLSEAEIKKKLYGDYETTSAGEYSASHEVKMSGQAFESHTSPKKDSTTRVGAIKPTSFGANSKPDLFTARQPAAVASSASDVRGSAFPKSSVANVKVAAVRSVDWKKAGIETSKVIFGFLTGILWKSGAFLVQVLDFALRILDPRKPQARKILYSVTACVLVAALFFGVFRLNAQRKKAMMGELKPQVVSVAPSVSKVAATPLVSPAATEVPVIKDQSKKAESQEAILKKLESAETSNSVPSESVSAGRYVIQVATYAASEDASRLIQSFNQAGFASFFKKQIRNSTGHSFYPVYLGRFESFSVAQKALAKFRKASVARPFQDLFIRTLE